jgi:hypothetical protein
MNLSVSRSLAVSLALCAMLLRALLPDGWMPNSEGGAAPFVICSADGTHHGKAPVQPGQERSHAPCAFAAAAPLAPPAVAAVAGRTVHGAVRLARAFADENIFTAPDFRPNAARAPPASA